MRAILIISLCMFASHLQAAVVDVTATFAPSMSNPSNNEFINTTPQSGYCSTYPSDCADHNTLSIDMGGITASLISSGLKANSEPRMGVYFKIPGAWREVIVRNSETGESSKVRFRVNAFSSRYRVVNSWTLADHQNFWNGSSFVNAPAPCTYSGLGYRNAKYYHFNWKVPASDVACYKTAKIDSTGEPDLLSHNSFGYELVTPNPLSMGSGVYRGELTFDVGPGSEIDFGDNYKPSDTKLTINFILTVNHELKLSTASENQNVSFQPCKIEMICSVDQGAANWERWKVNRITPSLTARSNFNLSSSGAFTVYLECEQNLGTDCTLKSDNSSSQLVPVQTFLTLPENISDAKSGKSVIKQRLLIGKDLTRNLFETHEFGQNKPGYIDFLIEQRNVDTMLNTRPDTYRGSVTVIFDPLIH